MQGEQKKDEAYKVLPHEGQKAYELPIWGEQKKDADYHLSPCGKQM